MQLHFRFPRSSRRSAFTLIELLVVIAIIAILAAILFPVFAKAKEAAKKTAGLAQMRQLGVALMMYVTDYDSAFLPSTNYDAPAGDPSRIWTGGLQLYVKNKDIFVAPGASNSLYAEGWSTRHRQSVGYSDVMAYSTTIGLDPSRICQPNEVRFGCSAFWSVASEGSMPAPSEVALFANTPNGEPGTKYRGFVFGADNGTIYVPGFTSFTSLDQAVPMAGDRDMVAIMGGPPNNLDANELKPIYCRYGSDGNDNGHSPLVFADGHAKTYPCKRINRPGNGIVWRFR
jgi:prepilin-type N-terminal cleavage/methylation domain-containing protein